MADGSLNGIAWETAEDHGYLQLERRCKMRLVLEIFEESPYTETEIEGTGMSNNNTGRAIQNGPIQNGPISSTAPQTPPPPPPANDNTNQPLPISMGGYLPHQIWNSNRDDNNR